MSRYAVIHTAGRIRANCPTINGGEIERLAHDFGVRPTRAAYLALLNWLADHAHVVPVEVRRLMLLKACEVRENFTASGSNE